MPRAVSRSSSPCPRPATHGTPQARCTPVAHAHVHTCMQSHTACSHARTRHRCAHTTHVRTTHLCARHTGAHTMLVCIPHMRAPHTYIHVHTHSCTYTLTSLPSQTSDSVQTPSLSSLPWLMWGLSSVFDDVLADTVP